MSEPAVQRRGLGDVIPRPAEVRPDPAADFRIGTGTAIRTAPGSAAARRVGEHLAALLRPATGFALPVGEESGAIALLLDDGAETDGEPDGDEGYRLEITPEGVTVRAAAPAGLFAAVQTLRQLLPAEIDGAAPRDADWVLPGGRITDRPRFAYRGVMLDIARRFFTVAEIEAYLDSVVQFKINHLHLHLTDDQGWRLEIDGWPRLTEVSGGAGTGVDGAGPGYLTRADYTELVAYAAERFVTIVPEIDMPGHVNAAQVAYPELTADGTAVAPRTDTEVGYSSLVAGKEETYAFVEDVVREVAALTPGPYLHIGGDEAQATTAEDYRTFIQRVLPLVAKYGKRVVGWHEMAGVELPETAVAQYWRIEAADEGTARAAANGSKVIMSPADRTYLDMKYTADSPLGLDWAGVIDVERSYDWDPAERLPGVGEEALLGVEAALWAETLRSLADAQTMTYPRLPAVAEIGWSPRASHDWESFRRRLAAFGPRWRHQGVAFHPSPEIPWAEA
ncbi:beta-N-acetylhexosaminidase [Amorphoplanes nipponensis]|uniref:beta-N-acetylhexosaminidase n=1 Tax=Actinoplanes nipponensis TaxID=135950 RepID=A0A919MPF9_9ACTN|nr:family 20 glycosylhydrolase [Actinoplanes nipponensis]GIE52566.1 beta-N-acetylhexosaminidase [Actinoplanes nipponensis]